MDKKKSNNIFKCILTNIFVKNICLMAILILGMIGLTLYGLNIYTKHNQSIQVPDLIGMKPEDAINMSNQAKLRCEVVDSIYKPEGTPGLILEQVPKPNAKVKDNRTIYLTIQSINEPSIAVPDLENASLRQSQTLLEALGFTNIEISYIPSEYKDLVYALEYKNKKLKGGEKAPKGGKLILKVGDGKQAITNDSINSPQNEPQETHSGNTAN